MRKAFKFYYGVLFLILLYVSGCVPPKPVHEERILSADRLIKKLEANRRKIKTFHGTGTITIQSSELNAKSNFEVFIRKPDSLRVAFYGPFGIDLAQVIITANDFQFYDVINNTIYRGALKNGIMKQILKVDMSFDEVVGALAGSINLTDKLRIEPDSFKLLDDMYQLNYADSLNMINNIYFVRNNDLAITQSLSQKFDGKILMEGKYSNFQQIDEVPLPFDINLNYLFNKQRIIVNYRNIEANKTISNFKLELPNDIKVKEW